MNTLVIMLIGGIGGFMSGLFGIGGAILFVPLLILAMGWSPHLAVGTALAVVVPTALAGALRHQAAGMVDWKTVVLLTVVSVLAAYIGAGISIRLDAFLLKRLFGILLMGMSIRMIFFP